MSGLHIVKQYGGIKLALKKLSQCQSRVEAAAWRWVQTNLPCSYPKGWISPCWAPCCHNLDASSLVACSGVYAWHCGWLLVMLGVPDGWGRKEKQWGKTDTGLSLEADRGGKAQMKRSFGSHKGTCNDANTSSGSNEIHTVLCTGISSSWIR